MTRKEQDKILDAKIESNVNQYKVHRMNAEISAFSSGDLNKYEFLKRIDLNYKPNALDKARFEFSPLGRAFNEGLDKTIPNYQEEGVIKLLKEIRDNLAGLPMLPGPPSTTSTPSPPGPPSTPSPPSPPSPLRSPSLTNITTPSSSSLTNVTRLPPSGSDGAIKKIKGQDKSSKLLKKYYKKPKKDTDIDIDDIMKEINKQEEKYKLLEEQRKLSKQKNEQDKLLKQQNDEQDELLEELKKLGEENILKNITFENIDKGPIAEFSAPRRYIKKPTPSPSKIPVPSKIPAPITKSFEPQGVAVGEQAGIAIMEDKLEASKNYIEYLQKELKNMDFSSKKASEISNKIIKEKDEVRKLEKEIRERKEDIERRFRKYYPHKYYSYKK